MCCAVRRVAVPKHKRTRSVVRAYATFVIHRRFIRDTCAQRAFVAGYEPKLVSQQHCLYEYVKKRLNQQEDCKAAIETKIDEQSKDDNVKATTIADVSERKDLSAK